MSGPSFAPAANYADRCWLSAGTYGIVPHAARVRQMELGAHGLCAAPSTIGGSSFTASAFEFGCCVGRRVYARILGAPSALEAGLTSRRRTPEPDRYPQSRPRPARVDCLR